MAAYRNAALKATAQTVKVGGGHITGWNIQNLDTTDGYLQFYDLLVGSVTVGTTTPRFSLWVPGSGGLDDWVAHESTNHGFWEFGLGLVVAATTTAAGSTPGTNGMLVNLEYA